MSNKKKVILFLGAISLIAFGNYTQFVKNNKNTTVESKNSEKATSSANVNNKEGKSAEKVTSSTGNAEVIAEVKSVPQPVPVAQEQNKPVANTQQKTATETKTATTKADNTQTKKEST